MEKHSLVGCMFCVCCNGNFHASAWRTVIHCMGWHLILWRRWTFRVISHTERKNNPHTILYDYGRWHHHEQEVRFADVECFYLTKVETARGKTMLIVIQYKENVELQKFEDASKAGRAVRRFNKNVAGSQYTLPADGLTIKPKDLCEILNERVKNSNLSA